MKGSTILAFMLGAGIGSYATYKLLKEKYETIAQEEIDSVKERYCGKKCEDVKENDSEDVIKAARNKPDITEYAKIIKDQGYTNYSTSKEEEKKEEEPVADDVSGVYPISLEEYGEEDGYDVVTYTYWSDGVLTDEHDEIIVDPVKIAGDFEEYFGDYCDDSSYVRNDQLKLDIEILQENRSYSDILAEKPHLAEG